MPADLIRSRDNALVRLLRAHRQRAPDDGVCLLEGFKLLEEALGAGLALDDVAVCPRAEAHPRWPALASRLYEHGVRVRRVADDVLESVSPAEASQGLLALARRPQFQEELLFRPPALVLVAVAVQDPGNLGGLLRTAEAAGATGAYLTAGCADPFAWKALRGSMGSAFRLPHVRGREALDALCRLRARGVTALAAAAQAEMPYQAADLRRPVALVVGNEGSGLPAAVVRECIPLTIPMAAPVESLNVGVAAGVLLFEAARQRRG
jgi:TrmH family RNA methyltransferase